jgi:hypothetical protein
MRRIKIINISEQEYYDYENVDTLRTITDAGIYKLQTAYNELIVRKDGYVI